MPIVAIAIAVAFAFCIGFVDLETFEPTVQLSSAAATAIRHQPFSINMPTATLESFRPRFPRSWLTTGPQRQRHLRPFVELLSVTSTASV